MKVLMINGSPRVGGNTSIALKEMEQIFAAEGVGDGNNSDRKQGYPRLYRLR